MTQMGIYASFCGSIHGPVDPGEERSGATIHLHRRRYKVDCGAPEVDCGALNASGESSVGVLVIGEVRKRVKRVGRDKLKSDEDPG
jgi:hypothetical protein